ncbi:cell division septation protein DedD [Azospirillum sp. OGB3]|uniref:SPOR domain-containing protein n=1 Tax=Azospirillum sp. OGB3 TaxID=2587012 RepID=UPI0016060711|nr:cell division septation protein DedD [Azospirillum sp. OGB3]
MTFKDEMKAAGQTADTPAAVTEPGDDIARLLRALNDDLKADPAEDDDDLLSPDTGRKAERHLPIGKIAAALAAAIGIGAVVVMLDQGGEAPSAPPAPLITAVPSAPAPGGASPGTVTPAKPEALITRTAPAPAPSQQTPMQTQTIVAPPTVVTPPMALPQIPPPALKVPEPPVLPSPAPAAAKPAEPAPHPVETVESAKPPAHPPASTIAPPPAEPAKAPAPVKSAETAELQAMLSAPPPPGAGQRPAAARPAPQPAKPTPRTASTAPATAPSTAPSSGVLTPPASASAPDGRYTVQVGSFQQADNAEGLVRRLRGLGFNAYALDWTDAEQRSWHVVRVGGYADTAAARQAAASLKGKVEAQPIVVSTR